MTIEREDPASVAGADEREGRAVGEAHSLVGEFLEPRERGSFRGGIRVEDLERFVDESPYRIFYFQAEPTWMYTALCPDGPMPKSTPAWRPSFLASR